MACGVELHNPRDSLQRRARVARPLIGLGLALVMREGLPSGDLLAQVCAALTAVVSATLDLVFALLGSLGIYPDALQPASRVVPFPSVLDVPGRIAIGADPAFRWRATLVLTAWALFLTLCAGVPLRRHARVRTNDE
jgi:hypothetical protein